jgi:protein O-GlcNAc transferase
MMNDELSQRIDEIDRLRDSGDLAGALALYEAVSRDVPDVVTGPYKEGVVLARMGRVAEAEQRYRDALLLDENFPEALNNLALLLVARGEWDEAERCFRRALAEKPEFFEASIGFANLLWTAWRTLESLFFARRAISLKPDSAKAYERVGTCLRRLGRIREALAALIRATELGPEVASCWMELAGCLQHLGRHDEADAAYDKAVEVAGTSNIPLSNSAYFSNLIDIPREQAWQRHRTFGLWAREQLGPVAAAPRLRPKPDRRLRVGFVSADFRRHSVAYFVRGALERLDRSQFQLFAYFDSHREDDVSAWLKPIFHHWRDIFAMQHEAVIEQVREDRIDILVDLSGHTGTNRNMLFARRAAPLQLNYLGYPNTTGLDTMDYRLTDVWADPEGDGDEFHSETLWRLQRCFLCYAPPDSTPAVDPGVRVADEPVVFGSFNSRVKISAACAAAWAKLLQRVPHSRLVLKSVSGTEDEESREGLRQQFVAHGISAERIEVCKSDDSLDGHLEHYAVIDVALDTFPYNGTTTTCEALWMGVPVVSLAGDRHAARVGHSLLSSVGLDELVARSVDEYIHIAAELSADKKRLTELRASMRDRVKASPLFDRRAMGQALGHALRGMWQSHCDTFDAEVPLEDDHVEAPEVIRLHIGGQEIKEGWKIFDITARPEVDFVGDLRDLSAFAEGSCAEVYASHVLEHLPPQDILMVLNGIHRILVPGGTLYLSVPDLDIVSWLFCNPAASKSEKFAIMQVIYGGQVDEFDLHRIGLNFDFMVDYLADVGFTSVEHVESFGLFSDASEAKVRDQRFSLNLLVTK